MLSRTPMTPEVPHSFYCDAALATMGKGAIVGPLELEGRLLRVCNLNLGAQKPRRRPGDRCVAVRDTIHGC